MSQRLAAIAALLLAPSMALAQATPAAGSVTIVESADSTENPPYINIKECDATTADTLTYYWQASSFVGGTYELWMADQPPASTSTSTTSTCPAQSSTTLTVHSQLIARDLPATAASQSFKDTATISQRLKQLTDLGASLSCTGTATLVYLCVNYTPTGGTLANAATGSPKLDFGVPPTPANVVLGPGDSVLHVSWAAGSGGTGSTDGYRVKWGPHNGTLDGSHDLTGSGTTSFDIGGLQNDTEYDVQVLALSPGNNESEATAIASGKPIFVNDFWRLYRQDGGREQGGCAAGAGGLLALLALVPLAWRRHRRRP
jgi:hypothetical protein